MKRREFITLLGGAAAAWPLAARAQHRAWPVIGFLSSACTARSRSSRLRSVRGLREAGYVEGQNVTIEYRWADGQFEPAAGLAADLVSRSGTVIVTTGGDITARAAKAATATIPIVFIVGGDPVGDGLVASLNRPGGNVTGVSFVYSGVAGEAAGPAGGAVPRAVTIALLVNPSDPLTNSRRKDAQTRRA